MKNSNGTNGHANGNGVAHKPASPDDRVARAEAHARGQARLRDDALVQLDRAAAARAAAEKSHGDAVEVHATALRASGAKPTDDALLDAVSRAAARVSRERGALDLAVRGHEHCTATATTAEGAVRAAERALECARMQAALQRPERLGGMVDAGRVIVAAVAALRSAAAAARDLVVADHELVRSARALGVAADSTDGLPIAFGIAKALVDQGGDLRFLENDVRWSAPTVPTDGPVPSLDVAVGKVVNMALAVLGRPRVGGAALSAEIARWQGHASYASVQRAALPPPPKPVAKDNWLQSEPGRAQATRPLHDSTAWSGDLEPGDVPDRDRV